MNTQLFGEQYAKLGEKVVAALNGKRFQAQYVATREEALAAVMALIPPEASVGMGGSETLKEIGVMEALAKQGNMVFNHQGLSPEEAKKVRKQEMTADVFLAGTNALTLDGQLINTDGVGNRVAALTFGPDRVIVVVGANKIVRDEAEGRERIKMIAAPVNAIRLHTATPCAQTGYCMECNAPGKICNITVVTHAAPRGSDFHVIVVGETLGF